MLWLSSATASPGWLFAWTLVACLGMASFSGAATGVGAPLSESSAAVTSAGSEATSPAQDEPVLAPEAVQGAQRAFQNHDFPWYHREQQQVVPVRVQPSRDVAHRNSTWEWRSGNWNGVSWLDELLEAFGWLVLVVVVLAVLYALIRALTGFDPLQRLWGAEAETGSPSRGGFDRLDALPFPVARPESDLLAEARRHYEQGDYDQAMVYLYSYQLVELDRHQLIRLARGKTNRQYLRELRMHGNLWDILRSSMRVFEDVFFGRHRLERERFELCWGRLSEFQQRLEPSAP